MPILSNLITGALVASAAVLPGATAAQSLHSNLQHGVHGRPKMAENRPAFDSKTMAAARGHLGGGHGFRQGMKPPFQGEKPTAGGKVTAISGSMITVQDRDNTTITIDASTAKVSKDFFRNASTVAISDIKVGDMVMVHGTKNGTTVTATGVNVMDTMMGHFHNVGR
ncbi:MAG: DUF5666 domain-containing protein [Patescibacteria group bacterium]